MTDYTVFIRDRITQLRIEKGVSEYAMSYELGQNRSYIQSISSGRTLPSMKQFLNICDYFKITPAQFFDSEFNDIEIMNQIINELKGMDYEDFALVLNLIERLKFYKEKSNSLK